MGIVAIDMSMSLDGYIAAPNDVPGEGMGDVLLGGGRRMFEELAQRIELKQTGLSEDGGVAHVIYRVARQPGA